MKISEKKDITVEVESSEEDFQEDLEDLKDLFEENDHCPNCNESQENTVVLDGKLLCGKCGYVYTNEGEIDFSPEWREFSNEVTKKVRGYSKTVEEDVNTRTIVLDSKDSLKFKKWQQKLLPGSHKERNKKVINENLNFISETLYISPEISKEVRELIEEVLSSTLIRGRSIRTITSAAMCIVLRKNNIPRTIKELSTKLKISKKELGRAVKFIKSKLKIKTKPVNPMVFLKRFISSFRVNPSYETELAWYVSELMKRKEVIGKGPVSIAGAIFFFFLNKHGYKITQTAFLEKTTITEVTLKFINLQIKDILIALSQEFDDNKPTTSELVN